MSKLEIKYIQKLPTIEQIEKRSRVGTPLKSAVLTAEDYATAVKLFDMAHGIQVDRLGEFILVKREEYRQLLRDAT